MAARSWVFTLNNPTDVEFANIKDWKNWTRIVVGEEEGEEGTPHLQGAVTFTKTYRLKALKELLPRAHWEQMKGGEAAFTYCKKDGKFWEDDCRVQGKRRDIDNAYDAVESGTNKRQFLRVCRPSYQAIKVYEIAALAILKDRPIEPIEVKWFWGPTGTGKTREAYKLYPDLYRVRSPKWWDGYEGQEVILFDDWRDKDWEYNWMLQLLDIYPLALEVKGGFTKALWKRVIITCPNPPEEVYFHITEDKAQLLRRITSIHKFPDSVDDTQEVNPL